MTLPGTPPVRLGHLHPLTRTRREIEDVFVGLGYRVVEGPEVEHDYYNFTALNYQPGHPGADAARHLLRRRRARSGPTPRCSAIDGDPLELPPGPRDVLLRTHTSPMQVRGMEDEPPPIFIVMPGRTYRRDSRRHPHADVPPDRGAGGGGGDHARRPARDPADLRPRDLRPRSRRSHPPALLPLHRAERRGRRLLLPLRRHGRARRRALQPLQGDRLARDPRRRDGRPERLRLRARTTATTPSASRASPSAWGSSGSRCSSTASPTCACSSTTTSACWSSSDEGPVRLADLALRSRARAPTRSPSASR